jgi:uncharacterized membrane protein
MSKTQQSAGRRTTARPAAATRKAGAAGSRPGANGANGRPRAGQEAAAGKAGPQDAPEPVAPAPLWLQLSTWALSLVGLGLSIYLTITHLHPAALFCSDKGLINCNAVTTSTQSKVFGIFPVAELGLGYYVFTAVLNSPWLWRMKRREVRWLRLASTVAGMGFVLYLLYAELIQIGNICLYCTGVHIVTFLLFVLIVCDSVFRQAPAQSLATASAARTKG